MIASIPSATLLGVRGRPVLVEVHVSNGLPGFAVVGLPDAACREARDRVRAALLSSGLPWPLRRVTVNLAPSGVRKSGAGLDLPIAVGLLVATGQLEAGAVAGCAFIGELGLDGTIRSVPGALRSPTRSPRPRWSCLRPALPRRCSWDARSYEPHARSASSSTRCRAGRPGPTRRYVDSRPRTGPPAATGPASLSTWRTCAARRWGASPSRSRQRGAITSCCPVRPARARPCWRNGSRACFPRLTSPSCWRRGGSIRRLACRCRRRGSAGGRFGRLITGSRPRPSSEAAPPGCVPVR